VEYLLLNQEVDVVVRLYTRRVVVVIELALAELLKLLLFGSLVAGGRRLIGGVALAVASAAQLCAQLEL